MVDGTDAGGSQQNAASSNANAPQAGGHMAGSGSRQNATDLGSNIPQTGGCIPCTPAVFNPPPIVAEIDVDDDNIDLDEDEDDKGISFFFLHPSYTTINSCLVLVHFECSCSVHQHETCQDDGTYWRQRVRALRIGARTFWLMCSSRLCRKCL